MAQDDSKYTKPGLRERIKKRITAGSKGGKPGQWSARKAQMVAAAYKKAGGGYKGCLLYTSPSPRDSDTSRMPSSA